MDKKTLRSIYKSIAVMYWILGAILSIIAVNRDGVYMMTTFGLAGILVLIGWVVIISIDLTYIEEKLKLSEIVEV